MFYRDRHVPLSLRREAGAAEFQPDREFQHRHRPGIPPEVQSQIRIRRQPMLSFPHRGAG